MSFNLFTLSVRNIVKHKVLSLINIAGLTIGFTAFIVVSLYVNYEYGWDKQNENYDRIYRAQRKFVNDFRSVGESNISPHSCGRTAKLLTDKCPEIEKTVVLEQIRGWYLSNGNEQLYYDKTGCFIDPSVFEVFTYQFTEGDAKTALVAPGSIVLSKSLAQKLFPNQRAMGKTILAEKKFTFNVTGVYEDLPLNSHLRPNYLISMSTIETRDNVHNNLKGSYLTYILLRENTDLEQVNKKVYSVFETIDKKFEGEKITLCPLSKIHLSFNDRKDYLIILFLFNLIGALILVLSAINYINLTTANAAVRAKETVIKKVLGGKNVSVSFQFLCESTILSIVSVLLALVLASFLLIPFNQIVNKDLVLFSITNIPFIIRNVVITIVIGFISGIYPALFMVRKDMVSLLKGNLFKGKREIFSFRKVLVGFQFLVSIFLVAFALYISLQIKYMLNKDLGFNKENLVYTKFQSTKKDGNFEDLRMRILQHPEFIDAAMAKHVPFISYGGGNTNWEGSAPEEIVKIRDNYVSYDFFKTMGIQITKGRPFSREFPSDAIDKCIINETACKVFGWENPIGMHLDNNRYEIIGVVKDFHYKDMHNLIEPAIIRLHTGNTEGDLSFVFRIKNGSYANTLKILNNEFERYFPNDPFEFSLLSDGFVNEEAFEIYYSINKTIIFFTILTILLAIIGLLGLVSFIIQRKTKEIGIRKINGSSPYQIFTLLNKELIVLILIASAIAWFFAAMAINSFPGGYKRPFEPWMMLIAIGIVVLVTFIVSFYKTYRAARSNPVEALRYE